MQVVRSVRKMEKQARLWNKQGAVIGLVPTMGYLHAGHLSLVKRARQLVGRRGKVIVSIYVNPTQFGPGEDFSRYPRDLRRDLSLCRAEGVDVIFVPSDREMYPGNEHERFSTFVVEEKLSQTMEGKARPTHFRGVTTVVAKLFNILQPQIAIFGAKDYQHAVIIRRMVRDVNFPIRIVVAPIVREADGLAMSSRNKYLNNDLRVQALALWRAIKAAREKLRTSSNGVPANRLIAELKRLVEQQPAARSEERRVGKECRSRWSP